mgnify:FL=1|jgi:hypothetical protein
MMDSLAIDLIEDRIDLLSRKKLIPELELSIIVAGAISVSSNYLIDECLAEVLSSYLDDNEEVLSFLDERTIIKGEFPRDVGFELVPRGDCVSLLRQRHGRAICSCE